jgi:GT2 family glycosyltransferase
LASWSDTSKCSNPDTVVKRLPVFVGGVTFPLAKGQATGNVNWNFPARWPDNIDWGARSMEDRVALSVIVPVYNGVDTLGQQLEALAAQKLDQPWELIVADNGSTDGSRETAASWAARIPDLRLLDASSRRGGAAARNIGAASSSGDQLLFCDQDDVVQPEWLATMSSALRDHDLVVGRNDFEMLNQSSGTASAARAPAGRQRAAPALDFYDYLPYGLACNLGVSRRAFEAVGGFDEGIMSANDLDLCWRLQLAGYPLHLEPAAVVAKRGRSVSGAIWRQHFAFGLDDAKLFRRFRARGMPRRLGRAARRYAWLAAHLHHLHQPSTRTLWTRVAAGQAGRLVGTVRERTVYL